MPEGCLNQADTVGLIAELRQLCGNLARQWAVSEVQLHRLIREIARPECVGEMPTPPLAETSVSAHMWLTR
jgi:hypothetical protein